MTARPAFAQPAAGQWRPAIPAPAGSLAAHVISTVKDAAANAPRSLQRTPGPSGLGTPCTRRLAYGALGWDEVNTGSDPWPSVQGTAVHGWMAEAFAAENQREWAQRVADGQGRLTPPRYLIEHRVHLPYGVSGSCDLFDRDTGTVIDWKVTGPPRLKEYRKHGPGEQYQAQAHLYGLGLQLAGERVEHVAIVFLPRGGRLTDLWPWSEPYDPAIAAKVLQRYDFTRTALAHLDPEAHPERWAMFPTADAYCTYCPFFLPGSTDLGKGCPGHNPKEG